ncbi:DUF721 domain-containing protein [Streptomyces sp. NPDC053079]|uniref:DUF721 domain-containing protein n=1 Tax=Streptomyces sp. NPDC053079 TaxID=3365697 RepID=UPI0037D286D0
MDTGHPSRRSLLNERVETPDLARIALRRAQEDARRRRVSSARTATPRAVRRGRSQPVALSVALEELLAARMPAGALARSAVLTHWDDSVGVDIARRVRAIRFDPDTGKLTVQADSPAWATQTRLLVPMLIQRLNQRMDAQAVRSINILVPKPARPVGHGAAEPAAPPQPASDLMAGSGHDGKLHFDSGSADGTAQLRTTADSGTGSTGRAKHHPDTRASREPEDQDSGYGAGSSAAAAPSPVVRGPDQARERTTPVNGAVEAAAERQSRCLPREPVHALAATRHRPASDEAYACAVLRARTQRSETTW